MFYTSLPIYKDKSSIVQLRDKPCRECSVSLQEAVVPHGMFFLGICRIIHILIQRDDRQQRPQLSHTILVLLGYDQAFLKRNQCLSLLVLFPYSEGLWLRQYHRSAERYLPGGSSLWLNCYGFYLIHSKHLFQK